MSGKIQNVHCVPSDGQNTYTARTDSMSLVTDRIRGKPKKQYVQKSELPLGTDKIQDKSGKQYVQESERQADKTTIQKKNREILIPPPSLPFDPLPHQMKEVHQGTDALPCHIRLPVRL